MACRMACVKGSSCGRRRRDALVWLKERQCREYGIGQIDETRTHQCLGVCDKDLNLCFKSNKAVIARFKQIMCSDMFCFVCFVLKIAHHI